MHGINDFQQEIEGEGDYWRLRHDAYAFMEGQGRHHGAGTLLFAEIERVAHSYARRHQLNDDEQNELFVGYAQFLLKATSSRPPRLVTVFNLADCLVDGVRRGLQVHFNRFLTQHIHASSPTGHLIDNLVRGLDRRFSKDNFGLGRWGTRSNVYWSEAERTMQEYAQIREALGDTESRLNEVLRQAQRDLRPLTDKRRPLEGYGEDDRDRLAKLFRDNFTVDRPSMGTVVLIERRLLRSALDRLVRNQFPELNTPLLFGPSYVNEDSHLVKVEGEDQEQPGLEKLSLDDDLSAMNSVLNVMETLAFKMAPTRKTGISGADVREIVRLYLIGGGKAVSREVADAFQTKPAKTLGSRPLDFKNMCTALPSGQSALTAIPASEPHRRINQLLEEFKQSTYEPKPRSHTTVQKGLARFKELWTKETADLGPAASAAAHRWLFDLLFLEVGQYPPNGSSSADFDAALVEDREE